MTYTLDPIEEPYSEEVSLLLSKFPRIDGYLLTLFRVFANASRFLEKGVPNLLDAESPLSLRIREIVILRATANLGCEYEWGVHAAVFGEAAKLTNKQISNTTGFEIDELIWTEREVNLMLVVDQLCATGRIENDTLNEFQNNWTQGQQLEILALCGTYHTVSFVANTAKLECENFAKRFPKVR